MSIFRILDALVVRAQAEEKTGQYQKEYLEKEELFERMISGETDIETPYVEDKAYIIKHMILASNK